MVGAVGRQTFAQFLCVEVDEGAACRAETLILRNAWQVVDRWLDDPRVALYPDPRNSDAEFRKATLPFASKPASKWVGDGWVLASAAGNQATLVTFDKALCDFARKQDHPAVIPG